MERNRIVMNWLAIAAVGAGCGLGGASYWAQVGNAQAGVSQ